MQSNFGIFGIYSQNFPHRNRNLYSWSLIVSMVTMPMVTILNNNYMNSYYLHEYTDIDDYNIRKYKIYG